MRTPACAPPGMRERRLWMVKTDIEFATLYAALLLRLRNPDLSADPNESEFRLTWELQDGDCSALREPALGAGAGGVGVAVIRL